MKTTSLWTEKSILEEELAGLRLEISKKTQRLDCIYHELGLEGPCYEEGDVVELVGGRDYRGRVGRVIGPRGERGIYWYVRLRRRRYEKNAVEVYRKGSNLVLLSRNKSS